ncbi:replication initiator [Microbispora sp. NPDC049125]|uniref:replication initiator n=1 Tax=Microbispora sp. NPDC049125 TaxID=3154929 RepID=UPI0034676F9D
MNKEANPASTNGPDAHPEWLTDMVRVLNDPGYERWRSMVAATGGCSHPVHLAGESHVIDAATGEALHSYRTANEPSGHLLIACGNRRASVCPACSEVYRADTYQLIRAGLSGGKGVPEQVSEHPRVFATLTAPSFGPVHTVRERNGKTLRCRPRKNAGTCPHGNPMGCPEVHNTGDQLLGQPICPQCYDYPGAVLWQAHAGLLWHRFTLGLRREMAKLAGISRTSFTRQVRLSFAKVAEYQRRGLVHFHTVIRLDGPQGPAERPPMWATTDLLSEAIPLAVRAVQITTPPSAIGTRLLSWGDQLDIRPILLSRDLDGLSEEAVAGYIAKYATKGAEASGTVDHRLSCGTCGGRGRPSGRSLLITCAHCKGTGLKPGLDLEALPVTDHARYMIRTCWDLGARPEFEGLRLRPWAHMLGFRGHFSSKSRRYSTRLLDLRQARTDHRAKEARERHGLPDPGEETTLVLAHWRFAGSGHTPGEAVLAEQLRQRIELARKIAAHRTAE